MHGRIRLLDQIRYGFSEERLFVRVDVFEGVFARLKDAEFRLTFRCEEELRVVVRMEDGKLSGYLVESKDFCLLGPDEMVMVACGRILEVSIARKLLRLKGSSHFRWWSRCGKAACPWICCPKRIGSKCSSAPTITPGRWSSRFLALLGNNWIGWLGRFSQPHSPRTTTHLLRWGGSLPAASSGVCRCGRR